MVSCVNDIKKKMLRKSASDRRDEDNKTFEVFNNDVYLIE